MESLPPSVAQWATALASGIPAQQVAALRQISSRELVTGLANAVVALSGTANDEVRMWAAEAMERAIRPQHTDLEGLISLLQNSTDGEVQYWAATMLGRLGSEASTAVFALENCLRDSDHLAARERAVWALCQLGPPASRALDTLRRTLHEEGNPRLKRLAAELIRRLTGERTSEAAA